MVEVFLLLELPSRYLQRFLKKMTKLFQNMNFGAINPVKNTPDVAKGSKIREFKKLIFFFKVNVFFLDFGSQINEIATSNYKKMGKLSIRKTKNLRMRLTSSI